MLKNIALAILLLVTTPVVANAEGFVLGFGAGGGNNTSADASILYTAGEETLRGVDILDVRQTADRSYCSGSGSEIPHKTLGEVFAELVKYDENKEQVILQVVRLFDPENVGCVAIWFTYVDK